MSTLIHRPVEVAFVDVLGPTPSEVLQRAKAARRPAIVVPAFLSRGYHVRADLPAQVAVSRHPNVLITPALGPSGHADLASQPLGTHPGLARPIANRFRRAMPRVLAPTARHAWRRSSPHKLPHGHGVRSNSAA